MSFTLILATFLGFNFVALAASDAKKLTLKSGERKGRIFYGQDATIEEFPYVVALEANSTQICGGSIISPLYVITAAHCFNSSFSLRSYTVRAGSSFINRGGSLHWVRNFILHEYYNSALNDLALIRLINPIELDGTTKRSIEMFSYDESRPVGTEAVVSGWGSLEYKGPTPDQLQSLTVTLLNRCSAHVLENEIIEDHQVICTGPLSGNIEGSTCHGDSGGPLVIGNKLAGVLHGGYRCTGIPNIFTKVAHYRHWIDEKIKKYDIIGVS